MALAMSKAAPLRPDIKLSQALKDYEAILTEDQKKSFNDASPLQTKDVMALTYEIDRQNASRKSRRWGPRLTTFLNSVKGFTVVADSIIGNTGSPIAGAVWGAVRMSMLAASGFESYFDALSTMLMKVGQSAPRYDKYALLYPTSASLRQELCNYFSVVVCFCKRSVLFVRKPVISQALSALRKPFNDEFGKLQDDLLRIADAVRDEVSFAAKQQQHLDSIEAARERKENSLFRKNGNLFQREAVHELEKNKKRRDFRFRSRFLSSCSTYNHETALNRARRKGASRWILEASEYKKWKSSHSSSVLLCSGIVGSGKTVLSSSVIEELVVTKATDSLIGYFFCSYDDHESLQARAIVGSLARQFLSALPASAFNKIDRDLDGITLNIEQIVEYTLGLLPVNKQYITVLDGLDECQSQEASRVLETLQILLESSHSFKLFWTGRWDFIARVSHQLKSDFHVTITQSNNGSDISDFIDRALDEALESRRLQLHDSFLIIKIHDALQTKAHGMFLWVTFQLESICRENTDEGILEALENLPRNLPTTYRRILHRLRNSGSTDPSMGKKVFEIVSAARRPLTLEELREATSIEPGNPTWNTARIVNDVIKLLGCCGSLVAIDEESSTVHFAHSSVKQYLETIPSGDNISEYHIATRKANFLMGEIVVTYLNLNVFQNMLTKASDMPQTSITNEASVLLRASLPPENFATNLARKLLKNRKTPGHDVGRDLERVACFKREQQTRSLEIHSFLPYVREYWLSHTESFYKVFGAHERFPCYDLWTKLVEGRVPTVDLPWTWEDVRTLNPSFLSLVAQSHHPALMEYACSKLVSQKNTFLAIQQFVDLLPPREPFYKERAPGSNYDVVLFRAVFESNEDLVQLLLGKTPADVNSTVGYSSILNTALRCANVKIVKILISHGADVNATDPLGDSPLEVAAWSDSRESVLLLLESGAARIPILDSYPDWMKRKLQECYDTHDAHDRLQQLGEVSSARRFQESVNVYRSTS